MITFEDLHVFARDFNWGNYYQLLIGRLTRITSLIPIFGYLILFNDAMIEAIDFGVLTGSEVRTAFLINAEQKIRLLFLGSICIFVAHIIYLTFRPFSVRQGKDQTDYIGFGLKYFTAWDFKRIHDIIRRDGHNTLYGKYYDDDWDAYYSDAVWRESGRTDGYDTLKKVESRSRIHSVEAKRRHEDLLRSMLIDNYHGEARKNRVALALAVSLAYIGYAMILLPTIDLSCRVLEFIILGS